MINAVIYLSSNHDPADLVNELLLNELVATVSIDKDNAFYTRSGTEVKIVTHTVITMQTRALLFKEICHLVADRYGETVPIHSVPIVAANETFEQHIRKNTKEPDARIATVIHK